MVRGYQSTYKRHRTSNLSAALQVSTGRVHTAITERKRRQEFLQFMDQVARGRLADWRVVAECSTDQELHAILDSYGTHKKCDAWLLRHPKVRFHYTPTSASWLNQV